VEIGLGRYFSQTILGESDIMVSNSALRYLGVNPKKRDKIELYFNLAMLTQLIQPLSSSGGADTITQLN
jgi:hypothetical protein